MQSGSQVLPDFSIGYGTEIEERGVNLPALLVFVLIVATVLFLLGRRKHRRVERRMDRGRG